MIVLVDAVASTVNRISIFIFLFVRNNRKISVRFKYRISNDVKKKHPIDIVDSKERSKETEAVLIDPR